VTILSLDNYLASARQNVPWMKSAAMTTVANISFDPFAIAGDPGAGTLAGTSTAAGVVPDDTIAGYPPVNTFGGGAVGYLTRARATSSVACRITLYDRLFVCGAYAFNAATTLAAQPSFSARIPSGTDYSGLEIWAEQVTAATGIQSVTVTYDDQANVSRSTGAISQAVAGIVGRCWRLPLVAGGSTVKMITNVTGTVATVGTFNVMVLRPLWEGFIPAASAGVVDDLMRTGAPIVYPDAALFCLVTPQGTALGIPMCGFEISNL
jgi:hypothetical protein